MEVGGGSSHGSITIEPSRMFEFFGVVTRLKANCFTAVTYSHMVINGCNCGGEAYINLNYP